MGLDIYLTPAAQHEADEAYEQVWEALFMRKESGEITQEEYDRLTKEAREADRPGVVTEPEDVEKSHAYPDHYCNRRYLRSSYSGGGFNNAATRFLGRDDVTLYDIFSPLGRSWDGDEEGPFDASSIPAWNECKAKALEIAEALRNCDGLSVTTFDAVPMLGDKDHMWHAPPTETEALTWFRDEVLTKKSSFQSYSCAKGDVLLDGMTIFAAVPGFDFMGRPAVHVIYRPKDADTGDDATTYYAQTAEICAELCDEALALIERDGKVYFRWSG